MDLHTARQLIIFGGSFDPPHVAHVALPQQVMQQVGADGILYVPAANAPLKMQPTQTPAAHRLAMLRLALEGRDHAHILTDELDRTASEEPSYTVRTLETLRRRFNHDVNLRLLIGADQLAQFHLWLNVARVVELAEPLVMVRPPFTSESALSALPDDGQRTVWAPRIVEVDAMDVSSSNIRRRLAAGESVADMVAPQVEAYVRRHGLYCA